ncbi:hypothetical protein RJ639_039217 [Escallonia herrerae]|uniref:Alcohol dehydrogenase n=1 Tax=Escallonia herrerae TaxID=1293975 RepID=A0AA88WL13_9ASTE|nr:hypothetical protein RJ639_039217 [Escallonia herrerae]
MNSFGRVAICGVISEYTYTEERVALDMLDVGFVSLDYMNRSSEFISMTADHLHAGKMQTIEYISHGVQCVPKAFAGLFSGENVGKKIVHIADD